MHTYIQGNSTRDRGTKDRTFSIKKGFKTNLQGTCSASYHGYSYCQSKPLIL